MSMRIWTGLAGGALLAVGAAQAQPGGDAAANWEAVVQCAGRSGAAARHACIDQVLRDRGVLDRERELSDARQSFGQERRAAPAPVPAPAPAPVPAPAAAPVAQAPASAPPPAAPPELKALQTQVAAVRTGADRVLTITTAEGAVWRQTQTIDMRIPPVKGDTIEIEESALGGHRCKFGSKIFRCRRVN
ncbi:MAG: hypothetical protein BGP16_05970 [Sphingobium sp. 66-54]|nr:MAG: hypothetical protein BGP16_05970 [Sphingobium sp. 66-54]